METIISSNHSLDNPFSIEGFEPLSPAKQSCISLDFLELVKSKSTDATSRVSTYDTSSIRTEDDSAKSVIYSDIFTKSPSSPAEETEILDEKMTLKEIISKRCHQRKLSKLEKNNLLLQNPHILESKHKLARNEQDKEEKIVKKEKIGDSSPVIRTPSKQENCEVPRLLIKDGKVQVDDSMLMVESTEPLEVVVEKKKLTTSNSFKAINHSEKWTEKETRKFYRALELFGTDFSLITKLFPNRNRNQIKNKFLKEEKISRKKIDSVFQQQNSPKQQKLYKKANKYLLKVSSSTLNENLNSLSNKIPIEGSEPAKLRSESFHSTSSIDSLDMGIIDDLSEMLSQRK